MGIFDKIVRTVQRNVERNVERKVEQEVANAVNKHISKIGPRQDGTKNMPQGEAQSSVCEPGADSYKYRVGGKFTAPEIPRSRELKLFAPNISQESRELAEYSFNLAQETTIDAGKRENYEMAAAHGHIGSMYMQGMIHFNDCCNYSKTEGLSESFRAMICSFEDAASYDHVPSMEMLGYIYADTGDFEHAKNWLIKAKALDSTYAYELLQQI